MRRKLQLFALSLALLGCASKNDDPGLTSAPPPEFTSMSPTSGIPGVDVTLSGKHLNSAPEVYFGSAKAELVSSSETTLIATVPVGAAPGPIKIKSAGQEVSTPDFKIPEVTVLLSSAPHEIKYWKNGEPKTFTATGVQGVNGLEVVGPDVYVVGNTSTTTTSPAIWKNGTRTVFSNTNGIVVDVAVDGADVHCFGIEMNGLSYAPTYWKNGVRTFLNTPLYDDSNDGGQVIKLADGKVYLGGSLSTSNTTSKATYWVDGVPVDLTHVGTYAGIFDMCIKEGKVYAIGYAGTSSYAKAIYWEDNVYHEISDGAEEVYVRGIALHGDDVYIVGSVRFAGAMVGSLWKNGVQEILTGTSSALKIEFVGEDRVILCTQADIGNTAAVLFNSSMIPVGASGPRDMVVH